MMAATASSSLRVVRINEEQLQQTAQCHRSKVSSGTSNNVDAGADPTVQVKKPPRRPAMAIYQPGVSRLARKKSDSTNSGEDISTQVTTQRCNTTRRKGTDRGREVMSSTGDSDEVSEDLCDNKSCRERTTRNSKQRKRENCSSITPDRLLAAGNTQDDVSSSCSIPEDGGDEAKKRTADQENQEGSIRRTSQGNQTKTGQFSTSKSGDFTTDVSKSSGGVKTKKQDASLNNNLDENVGLGSKEIQPGQSGRAQPSSTGSCQTVHSRGIIHLPPDISLHTHQTDKQETRTCQGEENKRLFDPHKCTSEQNMPIAKQLNNKKWQHVLQQAEALAADLHLHLSKGNADNQHVAVTLHLQSQIQTCYETLILQDPEFASKRNIDQTLWKNSFYNILEAFRGHLSGHQKDGSLHNLLALIDKGASFYADLLQKLQRKHNFNLDDYTHHLRTEPPARTVS
ncbi:uncharacterized protein LOC118427002 [Branchiostoma floridae]|uniref:Uncharacterized protein LOC118427002 n=1 Tax=Branchiostoma floridae TaxID=7739 RepID=A0A9J7M3N3_BRAFL|nr:uncharacterized protein LOC118427002 [Branchiostoma floridae]